MNQFSFLYKMSRRPRKIIRFHIANYYRNNVGLYIWFRKNTVGLRPAQKEATRE